jgi:hypothetical protein
MNRLASDGWLLVAVHGDLGIMERKVAPQL